MVCALGLPDFRPETLLGSGTRKVAPLRPDKALVTTLSPALVSSAVDLLHFWPYPRTELLRPKGRFDHSNHRITRSTHRRSRFLHLPPAF